MVANRRSNWVVLALVALGVNSSAGCKQEEDPYAKSVERAMANYADMAWESHFDAGADADALAQSVVDFTANPDAQSFNFIQVQWGVARESWGFMEGFNIPDGPLQESHRYINASNLDRSYIDFVSNDLSAGLVNDVDGYPSLTKMLLVDLHQIEGNDKVTTGFHAIEFLLWGEDYDAESDGKRDWRNFLDNGEGTAQNQDRRLAYLTFATELLVEDIKGARNEWREDEGEYRSQFLAMEQNEQVRLVLTGMYRLGQDMENRRLELPLMQMDIHADDSTFSDLSNDDLYYGANALQGIYLGRYDEDLIDDQTPEDGPGLHELVRSKATPIDERFRNELAELVAAMDVLRQGDPLEVAVLSDIGSAERTAADDALAKLRQVNMTLLEIATLFGFSLEDGNDDGMETGDGTGDGTTTGTDTGTTTDGTDTTDESGTVFLPPPDMG